MRKLVPITLLALAVTVTVGITVAPPPAHAATTTVAGIVNLLNVAPANPAGYDRALFPHWIDADSDGCDTRSEVLQNQTQAAVTFSSGYTVATGEWDSWYDDTTWTAASDVDIDHLVPLGEAWASGASSWTTAQRQAYANDLSVPYALQAVTDNVNQSKGDRDPAHWMPPSSDAACQYVTDWVLVKYRWSLTIDSAEKTKLDSVLDSGCGNTAVTPPSVQVTGNSTATVTRLAGDDRYATAVAVSGQYAPGVPVVYIASGADFPDALSAAPAAALQGGPLLLTQPTVLPPVVKDEIIRLQPAMIVVAGGSGSVSDEVYRQLTPLAPSIRRDAGIDRYATSLAVNTAAFGTTGATQAFVATAADFPDALSASAVAGGQHSPVILVRGASATVDGNTAGLLSALGVQSAVIAGGTGVVSSGIEADLTRILGAGNVKRLAGIDRYATSSVVNRGSFNTAATVYMATGLNFADALAGAALAGRDNAALYVVPSNCVPDIDITDLQQLQTTKRILLGGTGSLTSAVEGLTACSSLVPPPPPPVGPSRPANPGDSKNCGDFSTWSAAQQWFASYYPYYGDVAQLDADNDRIACETLPGHP